jgi:hypothetical protein
MIIETSPQDRREVLKLPASQEAQTAVEWLISLFSPAFGCTDEHRLVDANALVEESFNLAYHGARAENQNFKMNIERSFRSPRFFVVAVSQKV